MELYNRSREENARVGHLNRAHDIQALSHLLAKVRVGDKRRWNDSLSCSSAAFASCRASLADLAGAAVERADERKPA